jgi:hypothetical protein
LFIVYTLRDVSVTEGDSRTIVHPGKQTTNIAGAAAFASERAASGVQLRGGSRACMVKASSLRTWPGRRHKEDSMKVIDVICASVGAAAVMTLAISAQAPADQSPAPAGQSPAAQSPAPADRGPAPADRSPAQADRSPAASQDERVTVVGCVMRENDYRKAQDAGKGGPAGTGLGSGNEFVLTNASAKGAAGTAPGQAVGTSGSATAYELTGSAEKQAEQFVGKRVEISGTLKPAEMGAAGPTGGPTAGAPPRGIDVVSKDLKLRELDVASVKEAEGTCPAK